MYRELVKSKTAAKTITTDRKQLKKKILDTLQAASILVGDTLGPNGKLALIERQENLPPYTTKDGITAFNSMAFSDPTSQTILEAARDSSSKTNVEAGDGTTTATILAESLIRLGFEYLEKNPRLSVQKVMREFEDIYTDLIVPFLQNNSVKINPNNSDDLLKKVAMIATNSDDKMSDAVLQAFEKVGHNGNITIEEAAGASGYIVEKIEGLPIPRGFEDSCGRFLEEFINDKANYRTILDKPRFILYHGRLSEPHTIHAILQKIAIESGAEANPDGGPDKKNTSPNIVIVAHGFSDIVLSFFARNFKNPETLNLVPLKTVMTQQSNSPYHFLLDLSAYTGAKVFDPMTNPLDNAEVSDLGIDTLKTFEFYRYKSVILGQSDEAGVIMRTEELEQQSKQAESILDQELTKERIALLTGGLAKVKVLGSNESELKEKKHRVEDAVCAIKGALREGVLPGCGKTLLTLSYALRKGNSSEAVKEVLGRAFAEPFHRIFLNGGASKTEIETVYNGLIDETKPFFHTYDALNQKYGDAIELGIIDSASAVLMAIKNSLGVAKMLMCLSGIVVFKRDLDTDISEAKNVAGENEAMQEALKMQEQEKWEVPL